ncbi:hypothetical protein JCM10207_005782 [Rhodosporidiobolus poonsookiae]
MLTLTSRAVLSRPLRVPLVLGHVHLFSTAPPPHPLPPPQPPRVPVHRPIPHLAALSAPQHLFSARTRWIVRALADGHRLPRALLFKLLAHRGLTPAHVALWVRVLARRDPIYALQELGLLESAEVFTRPSAADAETPPCPDWLYLSLPAMVSSPHHVPYLASQLLTPRFAALPEQDRGLFVARCVQHFLASRHYVGVREAVEWAAYTPPSQGGLASPRSFARLLAALASERIPASRAAATPPAVLRPLVALLRTTMTARRVQPTLDAWRAMCSAKLIPDEPHEAVGLAAEMWDAGYEPRERVLVQVGRVFARGGEKMMSLDEVREEVRGARKGKKARVARAKAVPLNSGGVSAPPVEQERGEVEEAEEQDEAEQEKELQDELQAMQLPPEVLAEAALAVKVKPPSFASDLLDVDEQRLDPSELSAAAKPPSQPRHFPTSLSPIPSSAASDEHTTAFFSRDDALAYYATLRDFATHSGRAISFPASPFPHDSISWTVFFSRLSHTPSIPAHALVELLTVYETAARAPKPSLSRLPHQHGYRPPAPSLRLYTATMHGLLLRHAYKLALNLWRSLEARGWAPDAPLLDAVVRALCGIGRPLLAQRLLDFYAHRPGLDPPETRVSLRAKNPNRERGKVPRSVRLDAVPLNSLLVHWSRAGAYDLVYTLYREMEERYGVRPDAATISIVLDAARFASAAAGKGFGPGFEDLSLLSIGGAGSAGGAGAPEDGEDAERAGASEKRRRGKYGVVIDDRWDGVPAAQLMERVLWRDVLEANWQDAVLEDPLLGPGQQRDGESRSQGGGGLKRWFAGLSGTRSSSSPLRKANRDSASPALPYPDWRPFASTLSPAPPTLPHLFPNDRVFRSLIQLTGYHSRAQLIPPLLAWMKLASVVPSRWTLGLAMMYVDGEAAIPERDKERWRAWLDEWLGEENVPDEDEVAWIRRGGKTAGVPDVR